MEIKQKNNQDFNFLFDDNSQESDDTLKDSLKFLEANTCDNILCHDLTKHTMADCTCSYQWLLLHEGENHFKNYWKLKCMYCDKVTGFRLTNLSEISSYVFCVQCLECEGVKNLINS